MTKKHKPSRKTRTSIAKRNAAKRKQYYGNSPAEEAVADLATAAKVYNREYEHLNSAIDGQLSDPINHPLHYTAGKIECLDFIEQTLRQYSSAAQAYSIGNVIKYVVRAPLKGALQSNLEKAQFYMNRAVSWHDRMFDLD